MKLQAACLLSLSLLGLGSSGCVVRAALIGGADGQALLHEALADGDGAQTFDCWDKLLGPGTTCRARTAAPQPPARPVLGPPQAPEPFLGRDGKLRVRVAYPGGQLMAIGLPARDDANVVLAMRPLVHVGGEHCDALLFRDGNPVAIGEVARRADHTVLMSIAVRDLEALETCGRFAGTLCGRAFVIDALGKTALSNFERRFREERAQLARGAD
jgi:hypothetical protein